jgi:ketosteroid isomerase-like protein
MTNLTDEVTKDSLPAFTDAWNRHDIDALMSFMTDDCVFETSDGTRYEGHEAVRAAFSGVWAAFPDAHWGADCHFASGDRGVSEWVFTGTQPDGTRIQEKGCDIFTFRNGKIAFKSTYLK